MARRPAALLLVSVALTVAACSPTYSPGTLRMTLYGEEFIEEGIPSTVFSDGWSVKFDRFLVVIGDLTVASGATAPALDAAPYRVFDVARPSGGGGVLLASVAAAGGVYDTAGYRLAPEAKAAAGNASADDVALMTAGGFGVYVAGTATRSQGQANMTRAFAWGFAQPARFGACAIGAVLDRDTRTVQATLHGDHLFYDDLFSPDPNVSFALIAAADRDADGKVTQAELAATELATQSRYQVGSTGIKDLWAFIAYQVGSIGHIDGEGHCDDASRD